jgi:hypothetical protein
MSKTKQAVDRAIEQKQGSSFRRHLGASIIGKECARQIWYTFRWAKEVRHHARILRLFERGNLEEERIAKFLAQAGIGIRTRDPETNEQFRVTFCDGHFGGSEDAELIMVPDWHDPMQWLLGEFKTHNEKSFSALKKNGVKKAKFDHYVQMQVYMQLKGLPAAMYFAICKNDDDWHVELILADPATAEEYLDRAVKIISTNETPDRPPNANPGWYLCNFCDFKDVCHFDHPKAVNCRTCVHSRPVAGGTSEGIWVCTLYGNYQLSEAEQRKGCSTHKPIP